MSEKLEKLDIHMTTTSQVYNELLKKPKLLSRLAGLDDSRLIPLFIRAIRSSIKETYKVNLKTLVLLYCELFNREFSSSLESYIANVLLDLEFVNVYTFTALPKKAVKKANWFKEAQFKLPPNLEKITIYMPPKNA